MGDTSADLSIGMFGGGGVGKTCMTLRFVKNEFTEGYIPTIDDKFFTDHEIGGEMKRIEIIDTSGQDDFSEMRYRYYGTCDGIILVLSLVEPRTVPQIRDYFNDIVSVKNPDQIAFAIACNKLDLVTEITKEIKTTKYEEEFHCKSFKTSAKTGEGIKEIFEEVINAAWNKKHPPVQEQDPNQEAPQEAPKEEENANQQQNEPGCCLIL